MPLGGVTTAVHFVRATKTGIDLKTSRDPISGEAAANLKIRAQLDPVVAGAPIALDVIDSKGNSIAIVPARTQADGSASWLLGDLIARKLLPPLRPGETYTVQADFYGTPRWGASSSQPGSFTIR